MSDANIEQLIQANIAVLADVKKLLEANKKPGIEQIEEQAKEHIIEFMLEHMNIPFVEDETEKKIYDAILSIIFKVADKLI